MNALPERMRLRAIALLPTIFFIFVVPGICLSSDAPTNDDTEDPVAAAPADDTIGLLEVEVRTRNEAGRVFCALWPQARGFPIERAAASHETMSDVLEGRSTTLRFGRLRAGPYALACFHDENQNGQLDTNYVGIPSEGTGASNDARGFMGPPRFRDARFELTEAGPARLAVEIQY